MEDSCGVGRTTRVVGESGRPCGQFGPVKRQCGSNADLTVGSTRGWPVIQISCGGIGVHARLL